MLFNIQQYAICKHPFNVFLITGISFILGNPAVELDIFDDSKHPWVLFSFFSEAIRKIKSHSHFDFYCSSTCKFFFHAVHVHIFEFVWRLRLTPIILSTAFIIPTQRHSDSPPIASATLTLCSLQLLPLTHAALLSAVSHSDQLPAYTLNCTHILCAV